MEKNHHLHFSKGAFFVLLVLGKCLQKNEFFCSYAYSKNQDEDECCEILGWLHDVEQVKAYFTEIQAEQQLMRLVYGCKKFCKIFIILLFY